MHLSVAMWLLLLALLLNCLLPELLSTVVWRTVGLMLLVLQLLAEERRALLAHLAEQVGRLQRCYC